MKINKSDSNQAVYIIAEVGNNHEGNLQLAQDMIGLAAESGVDAVKFQTCVPELFVNSNDEKRFQQMKKFSFSFSEFQQLAEYATSIDIDFISTPLDLESAKFLNSIQSIFKIASGDNTFYPLLETIASFGKPIILSTGLANLDTISNSVDFINKIWKSNGIVSELALLHCVTSYPVPIEYSNLSMIRKLYSKFPDLTIGYSDHTIGTKACIAAVAAGSRIIEKHFTIDNNYSDFRDHQMSSDPKEMKTLVSAIREVERMMGNMSNEVQTIESEIEQNIRRSIASARDIKKGTCLQLSDLCWVRPGSGIPPGDENKVIGRVINTDLVRGEIINPEYLTNP